MSRFWSGGASTGLPMRMMFRVYSRPSGGEASGWVRMRVRSNACASGGGQRYSMTKHADQMTSVSALMGVAVADASGQTLGHVREFAVQPPVDANHVQALVLKRSGAGRRKRMTLAAVGDLELTAAGGLRLRGEATPKQMPEEDSYLLLERDLLDQQIIDVHGHKVVRVNDVDLVWEASGAGGVEDAPCAVKELAEGCTLSLRIAEVEVGTRGAVRRLLKGLPAATVERAAARF